MSGSETMHTPFLAVDLDVAAANIRRTIELVGTPGRWRPHVKTAKIPAVFDLLLAAGVRHYKAATTKEARELLARAGEPIDLLVAMAHHGANLDAVAQLAERNPDHAISLLTEDPAHARAVRAASSRLGLFVDLDPGYHRTGIPPGDRTRVRATVDACGDALAGLHDYDGHLHDGTPEQRAKVCAGIYAELIALVDDLDLRGRALELITSGTPTFPHAIAFADFEPFAHRVSPGTVVYWDLISQTATRLDGYDFAATVLARVVSRPAADRATCDAGSKALDAAAGVPCCAVAGHSDWEPQRPSEEHLPIHVPSGAAPALGTLLRLIPRHVCPTVNLADQAVLTRGGEIVDVVPVAARGHDVLPEAPRTLQHPT